MGRKQQATGKTYEQMVDISLRRYRVEERAIGQTNYPQVTVTRFPAARIIGKAHADRTVTLAGAFGGQTCHIEIKTWQAKDQHTYNFQGKHRKREKQYQKLLEATRFGALGYYLVCWRHNGSEDWRLHPVATLTVNERGAVFVRRDGIPVDDSRGWPDWLGAIS